MTIIVWDGKTLAADKQTTMFGQKIKSTKIHKWKGNLFGCSGTGVLNESMMEWFKDGANPELFPENIEIGSDENCHMLVITPESKILYYEECAYPMDFTENGIFAIGSGAPYAYAAMAMGADAIKAVEITSLFSADCGIGIDTLTLGKD